MDIKVLIDNIEKLFLKINGISINDLKIVINQSIDLLLKLNDQLLRMNDSNINLFMERYSSDVVKIVEMINHSQGIPKELGNMLNIYYKHFQAIKSYLNSMEKKKIIIWGISPILNVIPNILKENTYIMDIVDDNTVNIGKIYNGRIIESGIQLSKYDFDYLITCKKIDDKLLASIPNQKVIKYEEFWNTFLLSPEYSNIYSSFVESEKNYEGVITGLSYAQKSINPDYLQKSFLNLAGPTQDLFYDFELLRIAFAERNKDCIIKFCIIGLGLYSFQYDLSKSINKSRVHYYYLTTGNPHNYEDKDKLKSYLLSFENLTKDIFVENHVVIAFKYHVQLVKPEQITKEFNENLLTEMERSKVYNDTLKDFNKNYPLTVIENKQIFKEYLTFLMENNIMPIVVVPPLTKIYQRNISTVIESEFLNIIKDFQQDFSFQFLNYSRSEQFSDDEFYDPSHMNQKGAIHFTQILQSEIDW